MDKDNTNIERTVLLAMSIIGRIVAFFTALNGLFDKSQRDF